MSAFHISPSISRLQVVKIRLDDIQGTSRHHHRNHHKHHNPGTSGVHHNNNNPLTRVPGADVLSPNPVIPRSGPSSSDDNQSDNSRRSDDPSERRKAIEQPSGQRNPVHRKDQELDEDNDNDADQMINQFNDSPGQESLLKSQNPIVIAIGLGFLLVLVLVSATALVTRKNGCRSPSFGNRSPNGAQMPPLPLVKPLPLIPMPGMTLTDTDSDHKSDNDQFTYSDNNVYCEPTTVMVPSSNHLNGSPGHHYNHHQVTRVDTSANTGINHHLNSSNGPPPLYPPFITFNMIASHRDKSIPFIQTMGRRSGGQGGSGHWSRPNVPHSPSGGGTMNPLSALVDNPMISDHHKSPAAFQVPKFQANTSSNSGSNSVSNKSNGSSSYSYTTSGLPHSSGPRDRFVWIIISVSVFWKGN